MNYSITLKNLPFEPEKRQVIYVENHYDERINAIIKSHYEQLKWNFKKSNLDFVYVPMFFNDEETREKILYYAPYLTSEVMENAELRSSYLLGYMSHIENREKIAPSLLYAPKKENDEWIFQGRFIDIETDDRVSVVQWFESFVSEIEEDLAPDSIPQNDKDDSGICFSLGEDNKPASPQVEYSSSGLWNKEQSSHPVVEENADNRNTETAKSSLEEIRDEKVEDIISDLLKAKNKLRLDGMSLGAIIELITKDEHLSTLLVTEDYRLFLPDYDNKEIELTPLYKAVYFLFLNNPEGIRLQELAEHHHELCTYYKRVKRTGMTAKMEETINKLEYPTGNDINIVISKIRAAFEKSFDEHLAKYYIIEGEPGERYRIALNRELLKFEEEDE